MTDKLSREELDGKLGAMYAYAIAHMQEMGVSEGKRKEFAQAHREMKSIIKQHFEDAWHIINVKKELGQFYGKPVPEEKLDELIEKKSKEWLAENWDDNWGKSYTPQKWLLELLSRFAHLVIKAHDNLREGKEG